MQILNKLKKVEFSLLILCNILLFLAIKGIIPQTIYLISSILIGLYFNPIKSLILLQSKLPKKYFYIFSSIVVSSALIVTYLYISSSPTNSIQQALNIIFSLNLIALLFLWKINKKDVLLLIATQVLLSIVLFV